MEKQENFKAFSYNKITLFLTKFVFGNNMNMLRKVGFIESFIEDENRLEINTLAEGNQLYLLFKNKKFKLHELENFIKNLAIENVTITTSYELINNYSMVVITFPEEFSSDFEHIINGEYSKLSLEFKDKFPNTKEVKNSNNIVIGKEYTIYHHIFNKSEWLRNFWLEKLGLMELNENLELWGKPEEWDMVFKIENLENYNNHGQ